LTDIMRGKSTLVLVLLAIALGAFIFFYERHTLDTTTRLTRVERLLPEFNPLAVRAVLVTGTNLNLRAERAARGWRLTAPVAYPGQASAIEDFLRELGELHTRQRITVADVRSQPDGLAAYGLRVPAGAIVLEMATNRLEFRLGTVTAENDRVYLQLAGDPDVYTAGSNFVARLPREANLWRDPALLQLDDLAFNRVAIRAPGRGFEFERDPTNLQWRLGKPIAARADKAAVETMLQRMRAWQAAGFITDTPAVTELERFGLATSELELALGDGTNDLAVVQFGGAVSNGSELIFARRLPQSNVVTLPRALVEPLRLPFTEFRERRLVGAAPQPVEQIDVRGRDHFTLRRDPAGGWRVTEPLNFAADGGIVTNLLLALADLEVVEFVKDVVTDYAPYGLAQPARSYELRGGTNGALWSLRLEFGSNNAAGQTFTRRADEPSVYSVPAGNITRLPHSLFELRERQLWNFSESNVVNVTVRQGEVTRKLVRAAGRDWTVSDGPALPFNPLSVPETLHRLGQLRAARWIARGAEQKAVLGFNPLTTHELTLEVAVGDRIERFALELAAPLPNRRRLMAAQIEGETVVFEPAPDVLDGVLRDLTIPPTTATP
jgi:Domain of unknown function (DUF4340)